jgi:hypothetical protein
MAHFSANNWRATRLKTVPADFYRGEAERIQSVARSVRSRDLREELVRIAWLYRRLADQLTRDSSMTA